jgi:hypothetical protein
MSHSPAGGRCCARDEGNHRLVRLDRLQIISCFLLARPADLACSGGGEGGTRSEMKRAAATLQSSQTTRRGRRRRFRARRERGREDHDIRAEKGLFRVWMNFWHAPMRTMPLVSGSLTKNFTQSRWLVPLKGSPPIPITVVCPRPTCNDIFHRQQPAIFACSSIGVRKTTYPRP